MTQSSQQFTAAQVLEAGQRAEADGKRDYALQFYHYLTETYASSTEAIYAREALNRLAPPQAQPHARTAPPAVSPPAAQPAPQVQTPVSAGYVAMATDALPQPNGGLAAAFSQQLPGANGTADPYAANFPMPSIVQPERAQPVEPGVLKLPLPFERYRVGRTIAMAVSVIGWLAMISGLGAAVLSTGLVPQAFAVIGFNPGLIFSAGALAVGLAMVFSGQLARAVFDSANATRDLVVIEHVKARQSQSR